MKSKKFKMKIDPSEIKTRVINPKEDINFVLSSWLKSYRNSEFAIKIPNDTYYSFHQGLIHRTLTNPNNNITILCNPDDENQIIGYIAYHITEPIIYYVYIKHPFRGMGLARYLFEGIRSGWKSEQNTVIECVHKPRKWNKLSKILNLAYNPYIVGGKNDTT